MSDEGYPRDVRHHGGTTRLERRPQRIVLLSPYNELGTMVSLDVAPTEIVGVRGRLPTLITDKLAELGAAPAIVPGPAVDRDRRAADAGVSTSARPGLVRPPTPVRW